MTLKVKNYRPDIVYIKCYSMFGRVILKQLFIFKNKKIIFKNF